MFALGIMGEYLARIFDKSMDRPAYVIGETVQPDTLASSEHGSMVNQEILIR